MDRSELMDRFNAALRVLLADAPLPMKIAELESHGMTYKEINEAKEAACSAILPIMLAEA